VSAGLGTPEASAALEKALAMGAGVGICASCPGAAYADEIGVDVLSDLATPGTDVGVLVSLVPVDSFGRRDAGGLLLPRLGATGRQDPQLELAVRGTSGSAFVMTMAPEDVTAVEEIPPLPDAVTADVSNQLLRQLLVALVCPSATSDDTSAGDSDHDVDVDMTVFPSLGGVAEGAVDRVPAAHRCDVSKLVVVPALPPSGTAVATGILSNKDLASAVAADDIQLDNSRLAEDVMVCRVSGLT
jgi:hypothetical protein